MLLLSTDSEHYDCLLPNLWHSIPFQIFNVSERSYDISKFNNQVLDFGWPDHLAPSLERLSRYVPLIYTGYHVVLTTHSVLVQ